MIDFLRSLIQLMGRCLLRLRYRVDVKGWDKVRDMDGPILVMPNHPAYIDPPIISMFLCRKAALRPLVFSGTFSIPFLRPILRILRAFEVPDMQQASRQAKETGLKIIDSVVEGLEGGESFLIYPSGRLQRSNKEVIGGARSTYDIISRVESCQVVLVRNRGLWGSSFSCAQTGELPPLGSAAARAFGWLFASLIFFLPRRRVTIEVECMDREQLPLDDRTSFNQFLESWYNVDGEQEPQFVRYNHLLGPSEGDYQLNTSVDFESLDKVTAEVRDEVVGFIKSHMSRELDEQEIRPEATLDELGLDSLDRMDIALAIEDRFGFRTDTVPTTLGGLWLLASGLADSGDDEIVLPDSWKEKIESDRIKVDCETVLEGFWANFRKHPKRAAIADQTSGVLTYQRVLVGARLMSQKFKDYEGNAIAIMLPASAAADIVLLAIQMAGKIPVMLNWTTGPAALKHAVDTLSVKHVVTAHKLVDRFHIEIEGVQMEFLEDMKKEISKAAAIKTMLVAKLLPGLTHNWLPTQKPDEVAAVLFTSGSEAAPKAVPLTHHNLMSNLHCALETVEVKKDDVLLGFLPPFHSFGLFGNMLLPLVAGFRVVHYPDPTNAQGLVRMSAAYRPSLMFSTPTFLNYMLGVANNGQLKQLRIVVTGAEKCPEAVFDELAVKCPECVCLEGYGITECSPIVSLNSPSSVKRGSIGHAISIVESEIVDPDSFERLGANERGLLLVKGPNIFSGYMNYDGPSPFVEAFGDRWYNTGDLVERDDEGFLHFRGRMKRFLKAGGEMVSLPALEEPFLQQWPATEAGPQVAIEGIELEGGRCQITLFSCQEISLVDANKILSDNGFRGVMRLNDVKIVDSIPILGTGKTDYKQLRAIVQQSMSQEIET